MYYSLARIFLILIILAVIRILPTAAQTPPLQYEDTLEIITTGDAETVSQTFIITAGDVEITNLQFTLDKILDAEGTLAVAAEALTITPDLVEQLKANTRLTVRISFDSLPAPGTYTGSIGISYDQQSEGTGRAIALSLTVEPEAATATEAITESTAEVPDEPTPVESPDLNLIIATKFNGNKEDISFRIVGDQTTTAIPLFIRQQNGDDELSNVRFSAHLVDSEKQQLSGVSFNLTVAGTDVTETGITIPAHERQVLATLNVMNLTAVGHFTGSLVVEHNGTLVETATLIGERLPLPVLKIDEATQDGVVNLSSRFTDFKTDLRLSSANITRVEDLKIYVDNFIDPNRGQIQTSLKVDNETYTGTQKTVQGLGSVDLEITAELPIAGEYSGVITLVYANKRESIDLKVNRTRPNPTLSILGVETAKSQTIWGLQEKVSLWMTLHETEGQTVTLNLPQLSVLSLKGDEENTFQTPFEKLEVIDEDNTVLTQTLTITPGDTKRLKLNIIGLSDAGAYVGELMISSPDMTALEQSVTFLVKESALIACFWIALGVVISFCISTWLNSTRPKLERQQYANRLLNDLDREAQGVTKLTNGQQEVTEVVEELRRRLEDLYDKLDLGTDAQAEETLKEIDKKITLLRKLVTVYQRVYALEPPELVSHFRDSLDKITDQMRERTRTSADTAETLLNQLPKDIDEKLQKELSAQLEKFKKEVEEQKKTVQQQISDRLDKILDRIKEAEDAAKKGDLTAASSMLKKLRVDYARVLAENLKESLADIPFGFKDKVEWEPEKQKVLAKVNIALQEQDSERTIEAYQDAYAFYLTMLVEKLLDSIRNKISVVEATYFPQSEKEKLSRDLNTLITKLEGTLKKIEAKDLSTARQEYEAAKKEYTDEAMQKRLQKAGIQMGGSIQATIGAVLAAVGIIPEQVSEKPLIEPAERKQRERNIRGQLVGGDFLVLVVALLSAIGLGLLLLWVDNATWGGWDDYLVALLWGLGLYQVGNQPIRRAGDIINTWRSSTSAGNP